jgi:hypothetical protein
MEVWVSGCGVYAELLADTVVSEIGDRRYNLLKRRKGKASAEMRLGFLLSWVGRLGAW